MIKDSELFYTSETGHKMEYDHRAMVHSGIIDSVCFYKMEQGQRSVFSRAANLALSWAVKAPYGKDFGTDSLVKCLNLFLKWEGSNCIANKFGAKGSFESELGQEINKVSLNSNWQTAYGKPHFFGR
ncbi:hypothetical protein KKG71_04710 [Patescibacteria group bacterium]|nr:hypothetical protein [Patescibacteria group bacterium]